MKLVYFNIEGLAETSRLLFAIADVSYEDYRYPLEVIDMKTFTMKKNEFDKDKLDGKLVKSLNKLPYLEVDNEIIPQSKAIERYLAKKFNMMGSNLIEEAKTKIKLLKDNTKGYFLIPFDNYIGNKRVRYGWGASWGVSSKPCLFNKSSKVWGNENIHPSLKLKNKQGFLQNRIDHYIDSNISDMILRLDRYTSAKAEDIRKSSIKIPPLWITLRRSITRFYKCYITRKGYKEKRWGFLNATFAALFVLISYLKADLEENNKPKY